MEVFEAILKRRSIRKFKSEPVSPEVLERVLEAGRWAPSGGNIQPWIFIAVLDSRLLELIRGFSPGFLGSPPAAIVVCSNRKMAAEKGGKLAETYLSIADCSMAAQNMLLAATALGLGSCVIKSFSPKPVKEILKIPEGVEPEVIIALGYPDEEPSPPPKKNLEDVARLNAYDGLWRLEAARSSLRKGGEIPGRPSWTNLIAFLASAALECLNEPQTYGSFRLVDALSRLIEVLEREKTEINGFLKDLKKLINEKKYLLMEDLEAYKSFLEEVSRKVARESLNKPRMQT